MDTEEVLGHMQRVADELIKPRFQKLASGDVVDKGIDDLVTVADREAEAVLTDILHDAFPDAMILGEEASEVDPSLRRRFASASHAFTIDPVDGTYNFVHGSADYAVMIAEMRRGELVRSWILLPEHGDSLVAEKGAGAWCGTTRLSTGGDDGHADWRGTTTDVRLSGRTFGGLGPIGASSACAGVDYVNVARAEVDFATFSPVKPWDHAAGALLVQEAGGAVVSDSGMGYRPQEGATSLIAASSMAAAAQLHAMVAEALS